MSVNSFEHYPMSWKPDLSGASGPKYLALVSMLEEDIRSGVLKAGTKLPPQRELADYLDVNLSTVSRAFHICEERGLLAASVGSGTFVASDATADSVLWCGPEDQQIIDMGAILPQTASNDKVKKYMEELLKRPDALKLFSYGVSGGTKRQREAGAAWMERSGFHTDSDHILLAAGGQNALTAALGALFHRGDRVGTDPLTYPGVKTAARLLGIQLIPVRTRNHEMTEEGVRYAFQNENIKGLYVIPDFQNPTAHMMSPEARRMIAGVARETGLIVIEDGINNLLAEEPLPPVASFAPEQVIYLSSLSKTVSAGLRTAFVHVPNACHEAVATALYSMNIAVSPLLATVAAGLIEEGIADEIVAERRAGIIERNRIVNVLLDGIPVDGNLNSPLRYIRLPERCTGTDFERRAREAGVQVYGAERFAVGNRAVPDAIRISVTSPATAEQLAEGVRRLKRALYV